MRVGSHNRIRFLRIGDHELWAPDILPVRLFLAVRLWLRITSWRAWLTGRWTPGEVELSPGDAWEIAWFVWRR